MQGSHSSNKVGKSRASKSSKPKKNDHATRSESHHTSLDILTNQDYTPPELPPPEKGKRTREQEVRRRCPFSRRPLTRAACAGAATPQGGVRANDTPA